MIADRIPNSKVDLTDNYLLKQYMYTFTTPEPVKTTWAPETYFYSHTTETPWQYATEPAMPSQPPQVTPETPNFYSYTRYSHGKPQDHGVWKPSPPFQEHNPGPPHRIPRRRVGGRGRSRRPWSRRRWWQSHRRRVPAAWMQRRRDHHRLATDFGEQRFNGRRNHRRLHPPFGQRRMEPENQDYEWENESPPMTSRWDVGSPHGGREDLGRPGWGAPGWHRGWLPPPHDRQGPGEARRGEPQYRGMIRVDGWSSPRVLDSMLGVSAHSILWSQTPLNNKFQTVGTLGGMVASALAAASFGRRRKREVPWDERDEKELDLMVRVDKGVGEMVSQLEGRKESGMLQGLLNRIWNFFI